MITDVILRKRGNRVHSWLSVITAGLLAFHATVGCCAHRIHDCFHCARHHHCSQTASESACPCGRNHGDQDDCPTNSDDQNAPHPHGCDGVRCVFIPSGGSQQVLTQVATDWVCASLIQLDQCHLPAHSTCDSALAFSPAAALSVRIHLLHELFLI
jgi:hypothetical protein